VTDTEAGTGAAARAGVGGADAAAVSAAVAHLSTAFGGPLVPATVGLILGSGLGALADAVEDGVRVPFADVPGFAPPTVAGHSGLVVAGRLAGAPVIALQGRYHLYEGHGAAMIVRPVRALLALGVRTLIITNAAGGANPRFVPGDLMVIEDHINLLWQNPLTGAVRAGETRFPDMSEPYDRQLQRLALDEALAAGVPMVRGVYCAVAGPSYETPAEVRMLRALGADAVGMSTVPEVIVARAAGARVLGISLISNAAAGLTGAPLSHDEVVAAGLAARDRFGTVIRRVLAALATAHVPS
jgi:purine-nucleoside phosphorylase